MPKAAFGGKGPTALPWAPLPHMEEYLENLHADNRTEEYIRSVHVALAHFSAFAADENIKHPDEIERAHLLRFQVYVNGLCSSRPQDKGRPLSTQYRQQIMKYIRSWVSWLLACEHITSNPWIRIKVGRTKKVSKALENEDMAMLFDAHLKQAFAISPFFYHRREVILVLLTGWGLRIHELAALTVTGMDVRQDYVTARNKRTSSGADEKVLPYADIMKEVINRWLQVRARHADPTIDSLLINSEGRPLSTDMIYKVIVELGRRAGVTINPHRLRDTFGTTLLDHDVEIERIQAMMGHSRTEQTRAYARLNDHRLKASHDEVMEPVLKGLLRQ